MNSYAFNYAFNITGNASSASQQIAGSVTAMNGAVKQATGIWDSFAGKIVALNQLSQFVDGFARTVDNALVPGAALNASLKDLEAIADVTGDSLRMIEGYARSTAKTFGGSAAQSVESYKLLLGQLTPELAKSPAALKAMGENVAVLSKTMGGDATASAEVLTTAMNQYGVSLDDPLAASAEMARMMNVMAAAGKEGSAELPAIKDALEQSGLAAKAAGVSFEETNAAIQVLDKAGRKASEGGISLRNVMNTLAKGRFMPKVVLRELQQAGVDIETLTDKSLSLADRLTPLKGVMNDTALFAKLFGMENAAAGMALVQGIDQVKAYTAAITGTNTAYDQAATVMDSYNERKSRVRAGFDNLKISIFNATGDLGIWTSMIAGALVPLSQLIPLISAVGSSVVWIRGLNFAGIFASMGRMCTVASLQLTFMNAELRTGQMASIGFTGSLTRATLALGRFATTGLLAGLKAMGSWILSLVTAGTTSVAFAATSAASFATFKISAIAACKAVGLAIKSIPIIGWIAAAVAGAIWLISKLTGKASEAGEEMKSIAADVTMELDREKRALDDLYTAAVNAAEGSRERLDVVRTINEQYGQYLPSLLTEKSTNEEIAGALARVNTELANSIKLKYRNQELDRIFANDQEAIKTTVEEITEKIADWNDLAEVSAETHRGVAEAVVKYYNGVKDAAGDAEKEGWALRELFSDVVKHGFIPDGDINNATGRTLGKLENITEELFPTIQRGMKDMAVMEGMLGDISPRGIGTTGASAPPAGTDTAGASTDGGAITRGLSGIGGTSSAADKVKNINITIDRLVDRFEIHTTNLREDVGKVRDMVTEALVGAVNDVNYAL